MKMTRTPTEVIGIIERFLSHTSSYPQEWNDFVDCGISDPRLDVYRARCAELGSEFEPRTNDLIRQLEREAAAIDELRNIVAELRKLAGASSKLA
jgi:hypothetical protein